MREQKLSGYPSIDKPWLKYYVQNGRNDLPASSLYQYLYDSNKDYLTDISIIYFNRKITYKQLFDNIDRVARSLLAIGVREKEIVSIAMPNIPEVVYAIYAINKIGAVANILHPLAGKQEFINYLNEVNSRVFIMFDGTYEIVKDALDDTSVQYSVVVSPGESLSFPLKTLFQLKSRKVKSSECCLSWKDFLAKGCTIQETNRPRNNRELAVIVHTGGTTGNPKGVMLSDNNITSIVSMVNQCFHAERQKRMLAIFPPFHGYSLINGMIEPLSLGVSLILIPKYEPRRQDKYFLRYKPNYMNQIPPYLLALLDNPGFNGRDLSFLEVVASGGDSLCPSNEQSLNEFFANHNSSARVSQGWGCTELGSSAVVNFGNISLVGSIGIPMSQIICKIVDPATLEEQKYGAEGEICVTGPSLMIGYYNNQKQTDEMIKIHSDGMRWLHTGDLGYIDENGFIFLKGRLKRIMITKGADGIPTKLFPDRIERAILLHQNVNQCCVVGIPDEDRVNIPKAVIILTDKKVNQHIIEEEISTICRRELPSYMQPEIIKFVDNFPRTSANKVDYRKLAEEE